MDNVNPIVISAKPIFLKRFSFDYSGVKTTIFKVKNYQSTKSLPVQIKFFHNFTKKGYPLSRRYPSLVLS